MPHEPGDNASEELTKLSQEISLLREQLLTVGNALSRIEKRLTLIFPSYERRPARMPRSPGGTGTSTKSREELLILYETLLAATRSGGDSAFAAGIESISAEDLAALAFELGVTDGRKMGVKKARAGIRSRIQESLMLSGPRESPK